MNAFASISWLPVPVPSGIVVLGGEGAWSACAGPVDALSWRGISPAVFVEGDGAVVAVGVDVLFVGRGFGFGFGLRGGFGVGGCSVGGGVGAAGAGGCFGHCGWVDGGCWRSGNFVRCERKGR